MELAIGSVCDGKVTAITKYGAFVALGEGKTGMVHISEVAHAYVNDIKDHLTEGQDVTVKIIGIDPVGKISLSIKKAAPPPPPVRRPMPRSNGGFGAPRQSAPRPTAPPTFEDKLKQFMQDSESRMSDLKQHSDKRGGSSRRSRPK